MVNGSPDARHRPAPPCQRASTTDDERPQSKKALLTRASPQPSSKAASVQGKHNHQADLLPRVPAWTSAGDNSAVQDAARPKDKKSKNRAAPLAAPSSYAKESKRPISEPAAAVPSRAETPTSRGVSIIQNASISASRRRGQRRPHASGRRTFRRWFGPWTRLDPLLVVGQAAQPDLNRRTATWPACMKQGASGQSDVARLRGGRAGSARGLRVLPR